MKKARGGARLPRRATSLRRGLRPYTGGGLLLRLIPYQHLNTIAEKWPSCQEGDGWSFFGYSGISGPREYLAQRRGTRLLRFERQCVFADSFSRASGYGCNSRIAAEQARLAIENRGRFIG